MTLPLVLNPAALAAALPDERIRIIDVRSTQRYASGHIPEAVHADAALLNRSDPPAAGLLPEPRMVERLVQAAGIGDGQQVVVYDDGAETTAARMVWLLHAYGLTDSSWLDGGYQGWVAGDAPISTEQPVVGNVQPSRALNLKPTGEHLMSADELLGRLDDPHLAVLDVRSLAEYRGEDVRSAMGGHVPGAVHQNWVDTLDESRRLREPDALRQSLAALGVTPDKQVVVYCQSHQRSAMTWVMLRHLGFERVSALDGAWSVWGNRADLPKER